MKQRIKLGDLVTLIKAHPDHNKWFGLVIEEIDNSGYVEEKIFYVLGPKYINENYNEKQGLIKHILYESNLFLVQESNQTYED